MDIESLKISEVDKIFVNDSINAPILRLNIKLDNNTVVPDTNTLEIYVDKESDTKEERKTYVFDLKNKLNGLDEFIIEPIFNNGKVEIKSYVKREDKNKEEISIEPIILFEGTNYISTNYTNALISMVYPKNIGLVNYFLNNSIYGINNKDKVLTMDDIYFKDAFTEVDEGINANFNKLRVNCLSSNNGTFKLDAAGNLEVESIIVKGDVGDTTKVDFDSIYPIGSIYMTTVNVNPTSLFGGAWEQIEDKFLLSSGNKYQAGSTGGSETHTHNYSHTHQVPGQGHSHGLGSGWAYISLYAKQVFCRKRSGLGTWWDTYQMTGSSYGVSGTGSSNTTATELGGSTDWTTPGEVTTSSQNTSTTSEAQSLPPYLVVYMWRRTA